MLFIRKTIASIFSASMLMTSFFSGANSSIHIPQINGAITIDAKLDEPQWKGATKVLINNVTRPYDNLPSPIYTEALLMEDSSTLYLAFVANDPNPKDIRAFYKDRDKSWNDDLVGIKLDTYNDQRTAYRFLVNPLGVQIDGIENEITRKESDSWDGIWESQGQITNDGYIVEMALPLRMFNFNENLPIQQWGTELVRFYPRDERLRISNIKLDRGNRCEICQLDTVEGFAGAKQSNNFTITPSLVIGKNEELNDDNQWESEDSTEPSLDLRWGVTPDILLNATLNPDFSTVETDNAQLSINNNFALFLEEKRPFFLDNADYFESNYNLIYTRNINAPNYGAKVTGRHNAHSFGVFVTDDDSTNLLIPGNRGSSVVELERDSTAVALRYSNNYTKDITLGWISTLRNADGYHNMVHGIDGRIKLSQFDVLKVQQLYSNTQYPEDLKEQFCDLDEAEDCLSQRLELCSHNNCDINEQYLRTDIADDFSGNALRVDYAHHDSKWHYRAGYRKQNAGFRGDLGFISKVDQDTYIIGAERKWYAEQNQWWHEARIYSDWDITHTSNGELIEKEFDMVANIFAKYGTRITAKYTHRDLVGQRNNQSLLTIDNNTTLFTGNEWSIVGRIKPTASLRLAARFEYGDEIDFSNNRLGNKNLFRTAINWNANKHLELRLKQTYKSLDADNDNVFIARLTDFRATYQFNVQSFVRISLIYDNTSKNLNNNPLIAQEDVTARSKDISSELLYAYKINPQTVFYLGYSEHRDTEQKFSDLEQDARSVFMKFSYAWLK